MSKIFYCSIIYSFTLVCFVFVWNRLMKVYRRKRAERLRNAQRQRETAYINRARKTVCHTVMGLLRMFETLLCPFGLLWYRSQITWLFVTRSIVYLSQNTYWYVDGRSGNFARTSPASSRSQLGSYSTGPYGALMLSLRHVMNLVLKVLLSIFMKSEAIGPLFSFNSKRSALPLTFSTSVALARLNMALGTVSVLSSQYDSFLSLIRAYLSAQNIFLLMSIQPEMLAVCGFLSMIDKLRLSIQLISMNEYEVSKLRKQLQRSQQVIDELRQDIAFTEDKLVKVTTERDKYHAEIMITRESIRDVDKAIAQKIEEIRVQERKNMTLKLEEFDKLKKSLELEKTVSSRLTEENQAKDATILELSGKLRQLARRHNEPSYMVNPTDIKQNKIITNTQFYRLTQKYNKLCSDMENIIAENRILKRLHGVPENFGFDLEEIKMAEKQQLEDYKTQVKHLEAEVEDLEAERTQLRYRLRQFNTLYSNKGQRYKDFTPEQFELLDAYAMNLKEGRVELPQIDKSKKQMEKEIIKLRGQIQILQRSQPKYIEKPQNQPPPQQPQDMRRYQEEIQRMLQPFISNIQKIADNAQSSSINMSNINISQGIVVGETRMRPPVPLPHSHNDWSKINQGFSYAFNSKLPIEMKELYGELGFDTVQAKYEIAALQLQNMETMKMLKEKNVIEQSLTDEISKLQQLYKKCLQVQDKLFVQHFQYKEQMDKKVKQIEGEKRLITNQLDQVSRKLEIMEDSYTTLVGKKPGEAETKLADLTKRLAIAQSQALNLDRRYKVLLEEQKSLRASFSLMEKKSSDIEHSLRERLLNARKNEKVIALMMNSFMEENKDNVSGDAHKIVRTKLEIVQDRYATLLVKESELRKKLAMVEGVERAVAIKDKVIETLQDDSADLQLELQILRSRLSIFDANYRKYQEIFGRFVDFIKTNSVSLVTFFKKFDTSGDGRISKDQLGSAFNALSFRVSPEQLDVLFSFFDLDGSGHINYRQFLKKLRRSGVSMRSKEEDGVYKLYKAIQDANFTLRKAFDAIDKDGSNSVSKGEMESALVRMGIPITSDTVDYIFRMCDNDMDNKISYGEFEKVFQAIVAKSNVEETTLFETQLNWKYAVLLKIQESAINNNMTIYEAFENMDKDGSKKITLDELNAMFRKAGAQISRNNLVELFNMVDRDGTKWISYDEILELLREAHKEKQRIDRIKFIRQRAEEIKKDFGNPSLDESKVSEESTYKMRILALETKQKHFIKRHELVGKELANRQHQIKDLKEVLAQNQKTILKVQQDLYEQKQNLIRAQERTKGQLTREESEQLKSKYNKEHIENLELKSTLDVYKGMYESLTNKNKSDDLRFEKLEAERNKFYEIVKEFQGKSDLNAILGQKTIELENSKINEGIVNERYAKVVEELRLVNEQCEKMRVEVTDKQNQIVNTHLFLREKSNILQRTIDRLSTKVLPTITLQKVEELALRLREVSISKSQLEQSNKKLREENFEIQLRNDYLEMEKQTIEALEMRLRKTHPDQQTQSLIDMSKKLTEYKMVELRCKRESSLLREKEEYYMRINHSNQEAIKEMQSELAKWQTKYNERDEFWRKRLTDQVKITESIQAEQNKARQAQRHSMLALNKLNQDREADREIQKKLTEIDSMQRSKMNVSMYRPRDSEQESITSPVAGKVRMVDNRTDQRVDYAPQPSRSNVDPRLAEKDREIDQLKARLKELASAARQLPQFTDIGLQQSQVMTTSQLQTDLTGSMLRNNANRFIANQKHRQNFFQQESERLAQAAQQSIETLQRIIDDKNEQLRKKQKVIEELKANFMRQKQHDTLTIQQLTEQIHRHENRPAPVNEQIMMRSTNKFGNRKTDEKYNEVVRELQLKERLLRDLEEKYDVLQMEYEKKPKHNDAETNELRNKITRLERQRQLEKAKYEQLESESKRRIADLQKGSKDKDTKLAQLQKSLSEVKAKILNERDIQDNEFEELHKKVAGQNVNNSQMETHLQKAIQQVNQLRKEKKLHKEEIERLVKKYKDQEEEIKKLRGEPALGATRRTSSIRK